MTVVAAAWSPKAQPKVLFDFIPVCTIGSEGLNALAVAPVSLIADGMLPLSTPNWRPLFFLVCCRLHSLLFVLLWSCGRRNVTCLSGFLTCLQGGDSNCG